MPAQEKNPNQKKKNHGYDPGFVSDVHDYYTRQADLLYIQYAPTKRSQRTIKYYGTKLWNIISGVIQPDCAISTFKQKLKIFLLPWLGSSSFLISNYVSFHFIFFFLSTFSWLLIRWYPHALCTCSCSPCFNELAVLMNLGHISHHFRPLCQGCDRPYYALPFDDILCDVSCTCIVDYLVLILYNFDNKHTFTVIVIVPH